MLLFSLEATGAEDFSMRKLQVVLDNNLFLDQEVSLSSLNTNFEYIKNPIKVFITSRLKIKDTSVEDFILSQGYVSYYFRRGIEVKGGKQRYNLGRGLIWNPINIIDCREGLLPEYLSEGKWGIDLGLRVHPKVSSTIGMYFDDSDTLFLNEYEIYFSSLDITLLISNDREDKFHLGVDFVRTLTQNIYFHSNADTYIDNGEIEWRAERGMRFIIPQYNLYLILSYLNNSQGYRLENDGMEGINEWIIRTGEYLGISLSRYNISFLRGDLGLNVLYTRNLDNNEYLTNIGMNWRSSNLFLNPQYFHSSKEEIIKITVGYHLF